VGFFNTPTQGKLILGVLEKRNRNKKIMIQLGSKIALFKASENPKIM